MLAWGMRWAAVWLTLAAGGCASSSRVPCEPGRAVCGDGAGGLVCVDLTSSPDHCGGCGLPCEDGELCEAGGCVPAPCPDSGVRCEGRCVDPLLDRAFCGATDGCGTFGGTAGETCADDFFCDGGICRLACPRGLLACDDACVDPNVDPTFCGATIGCGDGRGSPGETCTTVERCVDGRCLRFCPPGRAFCDGTCVDAQSDPAFCGASDDCVDRGSVCGGDRTCVFGECALDCGADEIVCGDFCADPLRSRLFCGAGPDCEINPGVPCGEGERCQAGTCVEGVDVCEEGDFGVVSGMPWVVCAVEEDRVWLSSTPGGGTYQLESICEHLGYDRTVTSFGGTCNNPCGRCTPGSSCSMPGRRIFDGGGSCGDDCIRFTVMWECTR